MKYIAIILSLFALVSCNSGEEVLDQKEILDQINTHKMEMVEIQGKIGKLENQLKNLDVTNTQGSILVGIKEISSQSFTHYLDVTGNVEAQLQAYISPELNGLIKTIKVNEGDYVKKGTVLAILDTEVTLNTIEEVKTQLELATSIFNKQKQLWDQQIGSEIQYLQAKSNKESLDNKLTTLRTQLSMATITAPFSGIIETVTQKVGEFGSPSNPLFFLVNLDDLKVSANISESFLPYINVNDTVSVSFPTFSNLTIPAKIGVIGTVINPNNRTFKLQIPIKNNNKKLIPNIIAKVKVADQHFESAYVVPSIVVKNNSNGDKYVYVVEEIDNKLFAKKQFITTGNSYGNKTMVLSGIKDGDQLITKAYNLVKSGSAIRL